MKRKNQIDDLLRGVGSPRVPVLLAPQADPATEGSSQHTGSSGNEREPIASTPSRIADNGDANEREPIASTPSRIADGDAPDTQGLQSRGTPPTEAKPLGAVASSSVEGSPSRKSPVAVAGTAKRAVTFELPLETVNEEPDPKLVGSTCELNAAGKRLQLTEEVHIESIEYYLRFSVEKILMVRGVIPHLLTVMLVTMSILFVKANKNGSTLTEAASMLAFQGADDITSVLHVPDYVANVFDRVISVNDKQMGGASSSSEPLSIFHDVAFVGLLSLRVYRSERSSCPDSQTGFISSSERSNFVKSCLSMKERTNYTSKYNALDPPVFRGNSFAGVLKRRYGALAVASPDNTVQVIFPASDSAVAIARAREVLRDDQEAIYAVVLETLLFDTETQSLMRCLYLFEQRSGTTRSTLLFYPFTIRGLKGGAFPIFILVVDVLSVFGFVYMVYELVRSVSLKRRLQNDEPFVACISFWDAYNVVFLGTFFAMIVFNTLSWIDMTDIEGMASDNTTLSDGDKVDFFSRCIAFYTRAEIVYSGFAWVTMFLYLRTFQYLRFSVRLSVINETIGSCIHEMIGVWLILIIVFIAFALSGNILWGQKVPDETASVWDTVIFLFFVLLDGEVNNWAAYVEADNVSAWIFFLTFFIITWVVMLNVVVGVLALSFGSVVETMMLRKRPEWTPRAILHDIKQLLFRFRTSEGSRYSDYINDRIALLDYLKMWQNQGIENTASGPEYVSLRKLLSLSKHCFHENFVRVIFSKSVQQVGTHNGRLRQLRLQHRAINNGRVMNSRLASQASMVSHIHRKVCVEKRVDASKAVSAVAIASPQFLVAQNDIEEVRRMLNAEHSTHEAERHAMDNIVKRMKRILSSSQSVASLLYTGRRPTGWLGARTGKLIESQEAVLLHRKLRALLNAESDARYDLRNELLHYLRFFHEMFEERFRLCEEATRVTRAINTSFVEMAHGIVMKSLEARRERDTARRLELVEKMDRKRQEELDRLSAAELVAAQHAVSETTTRGKEVEEGESELVEGAMGLAEPIGKVLYPQIAKSGVSVTYDGFRIKLVAGLPQRRPTPMDTLFPKPPRQSSTSRGALFDPKRRRSGSPPPPLPPPSAEDDHGAR